MAITSTVNVDTVGGTITTNIYLNGSTPIDTIVYSQASNNLVFSGSMLAATISVADFMTLLNLYINFNQIITAVYSPSQVVTKPFSEVVFVLTDNGSTTLTFQFMPQSIPLLYYTCSYPSGTVYIETRALTNTLSYAQWLFFVYLVATFKPMLLNSYNL